MVIVESIVSAIVSILVTKGITDIETKKDSQNNTLVISEGKQVAKLSPEQSIIQPKPTDFLKGDVERVSTTSQSFDFDTPNYEFENPFDKEVNLNALNLVGDTNFYTKGNALIKMNDVTIFEIEAGDLQDVNLDSLPLPPEGLKLRRGESIKCFISSSDGTAVALTVLPVVSGYL